IRLAELADSMEPLSRKPGERESTTYYRKEAKWYEQIQADAKKRAAAIERGQELSSQNNLQPSIGDEAECLLRLQLIYTRLANSNSRYWNDAIQKAEGLCRLRAKSLSGD